MTQPNILLSNDDGIFAEGIQCLSGALSQIANVYVVAPDRDRSGASNSLTLANPLRAKKHGPNQYSTNGTPTDCVHMAVTGMLDVKLDMVISGINRGANMGDDILYSGTVAAATEGRFLGLPAIAVSLAGENPEHYATAAEFVKRFVVQLTNTTLPVSTILNVNVPNVPYNEVSGVQITRLGYRHLAEPVVKCNDPRGREIFWIGRPGKSDDDELGTDFHAIKHRYVSVTPLKIDLTHYDAMDQLTDWASTMDIFE